jgi:hypothetical protein
MQRLNKRLSKSGNSLFLHLAITQKKRSSDKSAHTTDSSAQESVHMWITPLVIYFKCGYRPGKKFLQSSNYQIPAD